MDVARRSIAAAALLMLAVPRPAHALEPLARYLEAGRRTAPEAREADAVVAQRGAETKAARAALYPSVSANASYTRNQYDVVARIPVGPDRFDEATFTPRNQLDASVTLTVPLLDLGAVRRMQSAKAIERASAEDRGDAHRDLDDRIIAAYTNVTAYEALSRSSARALAVAKTNLDVVQGRADGGLASELDVRRAVAQVAAAERVLSDAQLEGRRAARELEAFTGLAVSGPIPEPTDDLRAEAPLPAWLEGIDASAEIASARAHVRAAESTHRATRSAFMPLLSASATERLTNAAGFGEPAQWAVGVSLSARFDVQTIHRARADKAAVAVSQARYDRAKRSKRLEIEDAYDRVESLRVRARAARAEAAASATALEVARARYEGGTATQLEVVQALRDGANAESARIQADAELAYARAQLRLAAGRRVEGSP
jgi:outer membrane protein TolC